MPNHLSAPTRGSRFLRPQVPTGLRPQRRLGSSGAAGSPPRPRISPGVPAAQEGDPQPVRPAGPARRSLRPDGDADTSPSENAPSSPRVPAPGSASFPQVVRPRET
ncbi:RNA-binding protein [Platysternon megacephalum]|uniref:RNA-binding protein n=1 Tax=Platysternon megacephalum TaxID=55544 RepID=A0A4D9DI07_9SAUR|nr:RNA-binding protein [Platysternon megacephalum]